ncbi:SMR family transporter [Aeromonas sp. A-5]|uniref:SMR family transporter n=1 Tax=Aeromonas ichthyocola TaxID=3367746 RepID=UPI0038F59699
MSPLVIVLGARPAGYRRQHGDQPLGGFSSQGWGFLGILLVLGAFTLLSEAVSGGQIDLAVAYATWGAIGILGTALGGLLFFRERLKPIGWAGMMVMALAVAMLTTA